MKKVLLVVVSAVLAAAMAVSMVACGNASKIKIIDVDLSSEQYGAAIKKGNTELKTEIDANLEQLCSEEGYEVNGEKVTFSSLYEAEMAAQESNEVISIGKVKTTSTDRSKELVVATNAEFAPFEYRIGLDEFGGIDMQIAKFLADAMGKELVISHMAFEVVLEAVNSGDADIALAGLTINEERAKQVDFSIAYYDTTQRIAVAADNTMFDNCTTEEQVVEVLKGLSGVSAGAAKNQTGYYYLYGDESFEFEGYRDNMTVKPYQTVAAAVQDLANGTITLVCADKDTLQASVNAING